MTTIKKVVEGLANQTVTANTDKTLTLAYGTYRQLLEVAFYVDNYTADTSALIKVYRVPSGKSSSSDQMVASTVFDGQSLIVDMGELQNNGFSDRTLVIQSDYAGTYDVIVRYAYYD